MYVPLLIHIFLLFAVTGMLGCATDEEQQPIASERIPSTIPSPSVADAAILPGFRAEVVVSLLNYPTCIAFDPTGNLYIAEGGAVPGDGSRPPRILRIAPAGQIDIMTEKLQTPLKELQWHDGKLFIRHGNKISTIDGEGHVRDVSLSSAPSPQRPHLRISDQTSAFGRPGQTLTIVPANKDHAAQVVRLEPRSRRGAVFFCARAGEKESAALGAGPGPRRPIDIEFSPDGRALYIADFGASLTTRDGVRAFPETGVIWRVVRDGSTVNSPPANLAPPPQIERRPLTSIFKEAAFE